MLIKQGWSECGAQEQRSQQNQNQAEAKMCTPQSKPQMSYDLCDLTAAIK